MYSISANFIFEWIFHSFIKFQFEFLEILQLDFNACTAMHATLCYCTAWGQTAFQHFHFSTCENCGIRHRTMFRLTKTISHLNTTFFFHSFIQQQCKLIHKRNYNMLFDTNELYTIFTVCTNVGNWSSLHETKMIINRSHSRPRNFFFSFIF